MSVSQRWIIHVDLDAFFASVEELLQPELWGKPILVGGIPSQRGVVSSASYAARARGVRSAMPVAQALRLCPNAIVVAPHFAEYSQCSAAVMDILSEFTPVIEQVSIDEAFLDVTGCEPLWGSIESIGRLIQRRVLDEQHLPVSLGIASSKLVAKIACDLGKPRGLVIVQPGEEHLFLAPLPIERLWGVGQTTGSRLRSLDIHTIGELATWDQRDLEKALGGVGRGLYLGARGIDPSPVRSSRERRSISQEFTFGQDTGDWVTLHRTLLGMCDRVAARLRHQHLVSRTVRIKLRYPDFSTVTRQVTLGQPTDRAQVIHVTAERLLRRNWHEGRLLRLLGVGVSGLLDAGGYQLDIFNHVDQRQISLNRTLDQIRGRFGRKAITLASLLKEPGMEEEER